MPQIVRVRSVVAVTAILLIVAGCRRSEAPQEAGAASAPVGSAAGSPNQTMIGVSLWNVDDPRQTQLKADLEAAAAKHPDLRLVVRDAHNDAGEQVNDLAGLLAERVKVIIIDPINAQTLAEPVAKAFAGGTAVIVLDRPVVGDQYTCLIAPDARKIGAEAGAWLAAKLGGKGKIVEIQGPVDSIACQEQHAAFRAALRNPGFRFVYEGRVDPPRIGGAQIMREAIEHVQQFDAVYAYADDAAKAARETAHAAGRDKGVLFVGVGGLSAGGQQWVAQDMLDASVLHPTGGSEAIETAVRLLAGEKVPKTLVPGTRVFTKTGPERVPAPGN